MNATRYQVDRTSNGLIDKVVVSSLKGSKVYSVVRDSAGNIITVTVT